jgi:hypothetical protein
MVSEGARGRRCKQGGDAGRLRRGKPPWWAMHARNEIGGCSGQGRGDGDVADGWNMGAPSSSDYGRIQKGEEMCTVGVCPLT